jgi:alkaline phosphatase D
MRVIVLVALFLSSQLDAQPYLANGVKIGEVTDTSAVAWVRLTATPDRNREGLPFVPGDVPIRDNNPDSPDRVGMETATSESAYYRQVPEGKALHEMVDAVEGASGYVRVRCQSDGGQKVFVGGPVQTGSDYATQLLLDELTPNTRYSLTVEASETSDSEMSAMVETHFATAPAKSKPARVIFTVVTGSRWKTMDHADGHNIYVAMKALNPSFFVHTGDIVYYDHMHPYATHIDLARFRWNRMYALPRIVAFHNQVPSYFMRDDHDTWQNDGWPGMTPRMGNFTMAEGQAVFREQTPVIEKTYRTFRWGKDLQIWMTEGRDYRSPNTMEDGPGKTIWGAEQMAWFKRTVEASDATFKILVSPSPIVGPDHEGKFDNHSNPNFAFEGDIIRSYLAEQEMMVVCGDRHWQYVSADTRTGVREYSSGPTTDKHATMIKNDDLRMIEYVGARGGFLSVTVERVEEVPRAVFRHHDVNGVVVNEDVREARR